MREKAVAFAKSNEKTKSFARDKLRLDRMKTSEVLGIYSQVLEELVRRGAVRSVNNPAADYAEHLACAALRLRPAGKSAKGFDATDADGQKYEVKARRETPHSKPKRLSAIRDLEGHHFDYVVAVLFHEDFSVKRAAMISYATVKRVGFWQEHVNGWILPLSDGLWSEEGVTDITSELQAVHLQTEQELS